MFFLCSTKRRNDDNKDDGDGDGDDDDSGHGDGVGPDEGAVAQQLQGDRRLDRRGGDDMDEEQWHNNDKGAVDGNDEALVRQ